MYNRKDQITKAVNRRKRIEDSKGTMGCILVVSVFLLVLFAILKITGLTNWPDLLVITPGLVAIAVVLIDTAREAGL